MLIHDKFYGKKDDGYFPFRDIVSLLTERQSVEFALHCAKDVFHLVVDEHKGHVKRCLDLVEKWLKDENSVTSEELRNAAHAASAVDAAWAADAAVDAVRAYNTFGSKKYNEKSNEYLIIANSYFTKTNINCPNYEIEGKILYLIDELEENIIVHKNKYYVNMNGIENCPEYGFDSQQELLNELFNSKCLFWVFVRNWLDQLYKGNNNVDS